MAAKKTTSAKKVSAPQKSQFEPYTPQSVQDKAIIVTGGTTGIGLATARILAERGARVLVFGRSKEDLHKALEEIKAGGEAYGITADQSKERDIKRVFDEADKRLSGVDILINNAAGYAGSVVDTEYSETHQLVTTNLVGYMSCCHEAIKRMKQKGVGHIVNVGSMSADAREEESDIYVATKAGIQAFSESLRKSVNCDGIRVTLVEPGLIATDLTSAGKSVQKQLKEMTILPPQDIAEGIYYSLIQPQRCAVVSMQIRPLKQII